MPQIMIIEDEPAIREELTLLLENEGHTPLAITEFTDVPGQAAREPLSAARRTGRIHPVQAGRCPKE